MDAEKKVTVGIGEKKKGVAPNHPLHEPPIIVKPFCRDSTCSTHVFILRKGMVMHKFITLTKENGGHSGKIGGFLLWTAARTSHQMTGDPA